MYILIISLDIVKKVLYLYLKGLKGRFCLYWFVHLGDVLAFIVLYFQRMFFCFCSVFRGWGMGCFYCSVLLACSVVDPDPDLHLHGSGTFAWIRIRNYCSGSSKI